LTLHFLDSSALVKLFVDEAFSQTMRDRLRPIGDDAKTLSPLTQVEVRSALQRRFRNGEITPDAFRIAITEIQLVSARWIRIPLDENVIHLASMVIDRHALRSLDPLQLASALALRDEIEQGDTLLFIASDHRLLEAAQAENLTTWNPADATQQTAPPVN
jgi:uncharacterized protein